MGFFKKLLGEAKAKVNSFVIDDSVKTNKNFLEAVVAAGVLIAAADNDVSEAEAEQLKEAIADDDNLSAFDSGTIKELTDKYIKKVKTPKGRDELWKEVKDVKGNEPLARSVALVAVHIVRSDGEVDEKEVKALRAVCEALGQNYNEIVSV